LAASYADISSYMAPTGLPGNLTTESNWADATNVANTLRTYDNAGNVKSLKEPTVNVTGPLTPETTFDYTDSFSAPPAGVHTYAFPTSVTDPAGFVTTAQYHYGVGRPVTMTDRNGLVTAINYNDLLDRPSEIIRGSTLPVRKQQKSTYQYTDTPGAVALKTFRDQYNWAVNDQRLAQEVKFDGLGRRTKSRLYEPGGNIDTDQDMMQWDGRRESRTHTGHSQRLPCGQRPTMTS